MDTVAKEPFDIIDFARYVYGDDMTNEQLSMILTDELFINVKSSILLSKSNDNFLTKISIMLSKSDDKFLTNDDAEALLDEREQ